MLRELKAVLRELERTDKRLQKAVYTKGEIQKAIEEVSDFSKLQEDIWQRISSLQNADARDTSTIVSVLSDLDADLNSCIHHIETVRDLVRTFFIQFTDEEIHENG